MSLFSGVTRYAMDGHPSTVRPRQASLHHQNWKSGQDIKSPDSNIFTFSWCWGVKNIQMTVGTSGLTCLLLRLWNTLHRQSFLFFGPAGKIINMTNSAHGGNVSGRQCRSSNWLKLHQLLQFPLVPGQRYLIWTVPAALADSSPDIGPLPCCWLQLAWSPLP